MKVISRFTKLIFIGAGIVVLVSVFSYGAVRQEQYNKAQADKLASAQAQAKAAAAKEQAVIAGYEADVTATQSKLDSVCTSYKQVAAKVKTVALPQLCQSTL